MISQMRQKPKKIPGSILSYVSSLFWVLVGVSGLCDQKSLLWIQDRDVSQLTRSWGYCVELQQQALELHEASLAVCTLRDLSQVVAICTGERESEDC